MPWASMGTSRDEERRSAGLALSLCHWPEAVPRCISKPGEFFFVSLINLKSRDAPSLLLTFITVFLWNNNCLRVIIRIDNSNEL